jgi:hypothetical protein
MLWINFVQKWHSRFLKYSTWFNDSIDIKFDEIRRVELQIWISKDLVFYVCLKLTWNVFSMCRRHGAMRLAERTVERIKLQPLRNDKAIQGRREAGKVADGGWVQWRTVAPGEACTFREKERAGEGASGTVRSGETRRGRGNKKGGVKRLRTSSFEFNCRQWRWTPAKNLGSLVAWFQVRCEGKMRGSGAL